MNSLVLPLVSVIIPTYNRGKIIGRAIKSVQDQLYKNIEIIVIDDGSSDNTEEVVNQFANVNYIYKQNGRQANARNAGLKVAKGKFICTLDSDDFWHPNFLTECINQMIEFDLDFVFANYFTDKGDGKFNSAFGTLDNFMELKMYFTELKYANQSWIYFEYENLKNIYLKTCPSPSSALVFNKDSMVGNWEETLKVADDWEYVLRIILTKKCKAAFCKSPLWTKYFIGDNIYESLNHNQKMKSIFYHDFNIILNKNKKIINKFEMQKINELRINSLYQSLYRNIFIENKIKESLILIYFMLCVSPIKACNKMLEINNIIRFWHLRKNSCHHNKVK